MRCIVAFILFVIQVYLAHRNRATGLAEDLESWDIRHLNPRPGKSERLYILIDTHKLIN